MNSTNYKVIDFKGFVGQYMDAKAGPFPFQANAIKIYPLSIASLHIRFPTPLFKLDYNFLLLFSEGGGEQQVDNEIIQLRPNDVLFVREGHLNAIRNIAPGTVGYYLHFESSILPQIFQDITLLQRFTFHPRHAVSKLDMEWMCRCCELIVQHKTHNGYTNEIQVALLKALILKLAETSPTARCKPDRPAQITMLFKELMCKNVGENRDLRFYADLLAVSENYLNRCVSQTTNKPPKQHINEMLVAFSKVLLQDRSKDIGQIAFELNFSDPSYFGRLFKQITRQTPTEYRNSFLHDLSGQMQDSYQ